VQKMAHYASFCFIMGPSKGEVPVFTRLWPIRPPSCVPRRRLTLAGLAILGLGLGLVLQLGQYGRGHPSYSWASCYFWFLFYFAKMTLAVSCTLMRFMLL